MITKLIYFVLYGLIISNLAYALPKSASANNVNQMVYAFSNNRLLLNKINQSELPVPYDDVLTQTLMTNSIKTYYHRTPLISVLYAKKDVLHATYSRMITMIVDKSALRNNPKLAKEKNEVKVVELAYITINFSALPQKVVSEILTTSLPFGQILTTHGINVQTKDRRYFSMKCNKNIQPFLHCKRGGKLYGRKNTLYKADDKQWIAHVIEILPTIKKTGAV
jgi:hypothetical protein